MSNKKTQNGQRKSLLTGASVLAAAAAALTGTPAYAQDAEDDSEDAIVVTGTRLARQDFEAISPVTTVGSEQLELTATLTTDSLLNELPQIVPGNTRTSNNSGGEDFATVDLRGLGPQRTLVLINGERVPASSTTGVVDLNTIPASLISRIEVVTGGASAVYGSDAMAGVVNFVLKDDYEGAEVTVTYGQELETGNAAEFEINGLVGGNFANGRGNLTAYASYYDRNKVSQSEYDYSRVSGAICYDPVAGGGYTYSLCDSVASALTHGGFAGGGGSGTPSWGTINNVANGRGPDGLWGTADDTGNPFGGAATGFTNGPDGLPGTADDVATYANNGMGTVNPAFFGAGNTDTNCDGVGGGNVRSGNLSFDSNGNLTPLNGSGFCNLPLRDIGLQGSSRYNYAPDNYLIIPAERFSLTTTGHYDFENDVRLNLLINYTNSRTEVQLAPTPATGLTVRLTDNMRNMIQADHPDLWAALMSRPTPYAPFTANRRTNEVGTRNAYYENNSVFFLASLEGSLGENWDWNLAASYGQVSFNNRAINSVNRTAFNQGLSGCQSLSPGVDGILGTIDDVSTSLGTAALPNCQTLDIFGEGTLTDSQASFLRVTTFENNTIEENRVTGYVRGDLFELPAGPIAAVFGFEYRDSYAGKFVDDQQRTGNIYGFNAIQDAEGSVDVYELYTEVAVPLVSEAPFAHYLGIEAGYRRSNYSSVGNIDAYKIGGEWAPVEWLRFRVMQNEATRAPSVIELFQSGDQGFPAYTDPCRDSNNNGAPDVAGVTQAFCIGQGVPGGVYPGFVANNSQVEAFAFGNPNLTPETAESLTYGVVFTPDWFPVGDLRASVDYYNIEITDVIAAFGAQFFINDCYVNGNLASCANVVRDTATGQIDFVNTSLGNQGSLTSEGVDIQLEWSLPLGPGQLTINELYSILESYQINGNEFAGGSSAGIGGALPDYKSVLSATYSVGDWTLFARWTYSPETFSFNFNNTFNPESSYIDVSARWAMTDNFTITANVDNLLDDYPPQTADGYFGQANTDVQNYRVLGRTLAISGRYRF
ncbi:TonB-dependent receptor domain-containing protein [Terricaulis sp.]|uniref:TonB-dependent receptor domain-containing protein n=1 Tax=Terricaulis sp. TaxID=2768686 RepID=UPI002AC43F3C|nr:TonB-dependent receptor [Terricaulis sp.]MDZ4692796.1 TonB-dependent receptor [Terricaulis sp.]